MTDRCNSDKERTNHEKGQRNEREAVNILARVYGSGNVDKVSRYSNNDPLRFIDVLAAKDPYPVRFVQVKTNDFPPKRRLEYASVADKFDESVKPEVWVRVDRKGWKLYEFVGEPTEWELYLEMDTCDHEETVEAFRGAVDFYGRRSVDTDTEREVEQ